MLIFYQITVKYLILTVRLSNMLPNYILHIKSPLYDCGCRPKPAETRGYSVDFHLLPAAIWGMTVTILSWYWTGCFEHDVRSQHAQRNRLSVVQIYKHVTS